MFCAPIYPIEAGSGPIRLWRDFLHDKNDDVGSLIEFSTIPHDPAFRPKPGERESIRWLRSTPVPPWTAKGYCSRCGSLPSL